MEFMTVYNNETYILVEKKSKFIANIFHVETREEAENIIKETRKKYPGARHNCYAYVIGQNMGIQRYSDNGEPQGTAGIPILEVIKKQGILIIIFLI